MEVEKMKVNTERIRSGKSIVGNASIEVGDVENGEGFRIVGFKILKGRYEDSPYTASDGTPLWVAPPAYQDKTTGGYRNIFFASNDLWRAMTEKVIREFLEKHKDV